MIEIIIKVLAAYFLGNMLGGDLLGRFRGVNLRSEGSGNVGATNAMRSQGAWFAVLVLLIDMGKAALAVLLIPAWSWQGDALSPEWSYGIALLCAAAVVLGHCYPVLQNFRGGKGVACMVGVVAVLFWDAFPWLLLVWVLVLVFTGYVGLASMLAVLALVVWLGLVYAGYDLSVQQWFVGLSEEGVEAAVSLHWSALVFAVWLLVFIVFMHRSNVQRLWQGTESRFTRVMLLHRWLRLGPHRR